ncbi:MAG: MotA/TolQ/ExbB proton channel family protein [Phycisphaerales bacterium]
MTFFEQFFMAGGPIVWFVLFPISLITVYLIFINGFFVRRKRLLRQDIDNELAEAIENTELAGLGGKLRGNDDLVSVAISEAFTKSHGDWLRMRTAIMESLQEQASRLLRKIEWLNLIGGVSPMVGLFGTVFGMIKLFNAVVRAGGQPQPAQLADGISVALVTTFWGLFIAIPALAAHGIFRNRIEGFVGEAVTELESIVPLIRKGLQQKEKPNVESASVGWTKVPVKSLGSKNSRKVRRDTSIRQPE